MFRRLAFVSLAATIATALISSGRTQAVAHSGTPQNTNSQRQSKTASGPDIARGKYLVEGVAMCGQCHTPRDNNGNPDHTRWLEGAPVPWLPARPDQNWPLNAPRIGGTPPANDADMIKLLTTGVWTDGNALRSPMPPFRMDRSDAEAVVAYLKSLMPQQ